MHGSHGSSPMPTLAEFQDLVRQANDGIPGALERLRLCIQDHPQVYQTVGDLSQYAICQLIATAAGTDVVLAESLRCFVDEMRAELLGDSPTQIERIAVDRIIVAHLEVNHLSVKYPESTGVTAGQVNAITQQKNAAERRLQNAMKGLLTLRSLGAQAHAIGAGRLQVVG